MNFLQCHHPPALRRQGVDQLLQQSQIIARFGLTDAQRKMVADGADVYLELLHFRGPLAPSLLMVMSEPADTDNFRRWWKAQTAGPYPLDVAPEAEPPAASDAS